MSKQCEAAGCDKSPVIGVQRADNGQWVRLCARHSMILGMHPEAVDAPGTIKQAEASSKGQFVDRLLDGLDSEADADTVDRILHAWHRFHYPYIGAAATR